MQRLAQDEYIYTPTWMGPQAPTNYDFYSCQTLARNMPLNLPRNHFLSFRVGENQNQRRPRIVKPKFPGNRASTEVPVSYVTAYPVDSAYIRVGPERRPWLLCLVGKFSIAAIRLKANQYIHVCGASAVSVPRLMNPDTERTEPGYPWDTSAQAHALHLTRNPAVVENNPRTYTGVVVVSPPRMDLVQNRINEYAIGVDNDFSSKFGFTSRLILDLDDQYLTLCQNNMPVRIWVTAGPSPHRYPVHLPPVPMQAAPAPAAAPGAVVGGQDGGNENQNQNNLDRISPLNLAGVDDLEGERVDEGDFLVNLGLGHNRQQPGGGGQQ